MADQMVHVSIDNGYGMTDKVQNEWDLYMEEPYDKKLKDNNNNNLLQW